MSSISGLDHVMLVVADIESAAASITAALGLPFSQPGRHPGWGTANAVLRFGADYLELITVTDRAEAATKPAGQRMIEILDAGGGWLAFVLTTTDLNGTWERVRAAGLSCAEPVSGKQIRSDGYVRRWRIAGHGEEFRTGSTPSLIEYGDPLPPGEDNRPRPSGPVVDVLGVSRVEVVVDDLDDAYKRYTTLFGNDTLRAGNCQIRLLRRQSEPREGLWTVALAVPDIRAAGAVLTQRGVQFTDAGQGELRLSLAHARFVLTQAPGGFS
ncbi:VOC family protein [Kibdelosporangium philippinense]|uniref:VOC family protein n=1 Tax=Kibdelosporangium philippinense TaxID=211113 RepID=A0ABS8Z4A8_9PSEU|nr:VOC family protein [Kibdelosporangium philippinense]MCE7002312.1 VOC family protein [Kibdelosporangium philippinense]